MKACTCFLLFAVFASINSSPVTTPTEDKRGANLALKNTPKFNVKETSKNVFVATNKTVIGDNNVPQDHSTVETFTDFMQELVIILNTYNDDMYEDFVYIVDKETKKYLYKSQSEFKNLLAEESNLLMTKSVSAKRAVINQLIDLMKLLKIFDTNVKEFLDYINSLYRDDAKDKFREVLRDLKGYSAGYGNSRTKDDFDKLIRECVRANVFIQTNLNTNVKRKLKQYIDIFMKKIKTFTSSTTNFVTFKPAVKKSNTYTFKISENIFTEDKAPSTSLKLKPTKTTPHMKEDNKRIKISTTNTNEARQGYARITLETSRRDERKSQQKNITHSSTNEAAMEVMFYMTTEKPGIVYKSERRSQLVEKMFEKESTKRQVLRAGFASKNELGRSKEISKKVIRRHPVKQLTTKKGRLSVQPLPLPGKEVSVLVFNTDGRRIRKKSPTRSTKVTTEPSELKDYLKRMRQLQTEVDKLKTINEINHKSKTYNSVENNGIDEHETEDKKSSNKGTESKNFKNNEHEAKVHKEKNKVNDSEGDVNKTNIVCKNGQDLGRSVKIVDDDIHHHLLSLRNQLHKLVHMKTTTKKLVSKSFKPLSTTKDNTVNNKLAKTRLKTTKKVEITVSNVTEAIKQSRFNETATKDISKVTENNINETTTVYSYRRLVEDFPSLFERDKLKEGLYPAHLWD